MPGLDPWIGFVIGLLLLALVTAIVWLWPDELHRDNDTTRLQALGWPIVSPARVQELRALSYQEYLATPEWTQRSLALRKQAGWRCEVCDSDFRVQVHHRTYRRLGDERPADLQVLCRACHRLAHREKGS